MNQLAFKMNSIWLTKKEKWSEEMWNHYEEITKSSSELGICIKKIYSYNNELNKEMTNKKQNDSCGIIIILIKVLMKQIDEDIDCIELNKSLNINKNIKKERSCLKCIIF